jgi:hypothetical protein
MNLPVCVESFKFKNFMTSNIYIFKSNHFKILVFCIALGGHVVSTPRVEISVLPR